jgi:hypothetical protein
MMGIPAHVKFEYRTYHGGRYVGCGISLHYIPHYRPSTDLKVESKAVWPDGDNYDDLVIETIQKSCLENNFLGHFIVEEITFHPVNSSRVAFKKAAQQAINSIIALSKNEPIT